MERNCRGTLLNSDANFSKEDDDQNLKNGEVYLETCQQQLQLVNQSQKYHRKLVHLHRWVGQAFTTETDRQTPSARYETERLDIVLSVRVFKPVESTQCGSSRSNGSAAVSQDILIHGSQMLNQLRDVITCCNDDVLIGNVTQQAPAELVPIKSLTKSAVIFVGDTFYSDQRDFTSIDCGANILQWMFQKGVDTSRLRHQSMESIRLDQLPIRLGSPYVYRHLDVCEHLIVFTDARLMTADDPPNVADYPVVQMPPPDIVYCDACQAYPSCWFVDDPAFGPTSRTDFCKDCFNSFYYDSDGQFVGRPVSVRQFPQPQWPPSSTASSPPPQPSTSSTQSNISPTDSPATFSFDLGINPVPQTTQIIIKTEDGTTLQAL